MCECRERRKRWSGLQFLFVVAVVFSCVAANAQTAFIHDATVHTVGAAGKLEHADVLLRDGKIAAVGANLVAPAGALRIEANGRALTPGLFAGVNGIGIEEVSLEPSTVDSTLAFGAQKPAVPAQWRPEFDVSLAFNPRTTLLPVARIEGLTFAMLGPNSAAGGSLVAGQGAVVSLDGSYDAVRTASRTLFVSFGSAASPLSGGSRAAQYMLWDQAAHEARPTPGMRESDFQLLTIAGRETLAHYLGGGRIAFHVDRAADIRQVLHLAQRQGFRPIILGGAEAWVVANELAAAKVPVLINGLADLPASFDELGSRLDNAALLEHAGVRVAFDTSDSHNARKIRQQAGNAVAHGMSWDAALAALTSNPAEIFGLGAERGRIEVGLIGDLVLWSGDPLEVTTIADQVWIGGRAIPMRSRQTELRDRYRPAAP